MTDSLLIEENSDCHVLISGDFHANYAVSIGWFIRQISSEKWVFMKEDLHPTVSGSPQMFSSKVVIESRRSAAGFYSCRFKNSAISSNSNSNPTIFKIDILCEFYFRKNYFPNFVKFSRQFKGTSYYKIY